MPKTIYEWLDEFDAATSTLDKRTKGDRFEQATKHFLEKDSQWEGQLENVWLWKDAPTNPGKQDTGIDLVAKDATDGTYWAIQCKHYSSKVNEKDVATFLMASDDPAYGHRMVVVGPEGITSNAATYFETHDVVVLSIDEMAESSIDWDSIFSGSSAAERQVHELYPFQCECVDDIIKTFETHDRCQLIMACGTGKTLTSLRMTEELLQDSSSKLVLFLAPSISLISQSMRVWANEIKGPMQTFAVCSKGDASNLEKEDQGSLIDVPFPASTNPETLAKRYLAGRKRAKSLGAMTVIFSTYQSIQVVMDAQKLGLPKFDLIICDEAHRTVSAVAKDDPDGACFMKVHSNDNIRAKRRLYMTATPRIFGEEAKRKAGEYGAEIASMDDESIFGPVAHRISFGRAVQEDLLSDYRIVVMAISQSVISEQMQQIMADYNHELEMPDVAKMIGCWKALQSRVESDESFTELNNVAENTSASAEEKERRRHLRHAIAFASSIKVSKAITEQFNKVINAYIDASEEDTDQMEGSVQHVDGTMPACIRKGAIAWLAETDPSKDECRILSNVRCLSEGIDVPNLDAVMYLSSRKSKVDIIQSVGRVMRKAPDKRYGYIIIPVFIPEGAEDESVLENSSYQTVWDVVRALRSHDERLDAKINAAFLGDYDALSRIIEVEVLDESRIRMATKQSQHDESLIGGKPADERKKGEIPYEVSEGTFGVRQGHLDLWDVTNLKQAIMTRTVRKCGTRVYWYMWTHDVGSIAQKRIDQVRELTREGAPGRPAFEIFLQALRDSLNPGVSEEDAIEMIAQFEITQPIFDVLLPVLKSYVITQSLLVWRG